MIFKEPASTDRILRKLYFALHRKYSSVDSEFIYDALSDAIEVCLKYPKEEQTTGLLYTIAYRNLYHKTSDPKKKKTSSIEGFTAKGIDFASPDDLELEFTISETLSQLMLELKEKEKDLVQMRLDDIPFKEIAIITGVKKNTLEQRHKRIIEKLSLIARKDIEGTNVKSCQFTANSQQPTANSQKRRENHDFDNYLKYSFFLSVFWVKNTFTIIPI